MRGGPARLTFAAGLFATMVASASQAAENLGPHGGLVRAGESACRACHLGRPGRSEVAVPWDEALPAGATPRFADDIARFCWLCHRAGNPYGASALEGRAFAAPGHGLPTGPVNVPDAWAAQRRFEEQVVKRPSPFQVGSITCATCHDVHEHRVPGFLRPPATETDASPLCSACHPGRDNAGRVGRENVTVREQVPYSTHPAGSPAADLPGNGTSFFGAPGGGRVTCMSCHDVHGGADPRRARPGGLLRIDPGAETADLCRRCHPDPQGKASGGHPTGGRRAATAMAAGAFATLDGVPREWWAGLHHDAGAESFSTMGKRGVTCTSCHDLHGGLPMTSILYAPNPVESGRGDWCFSCHRGEALFAAGHGAGSPVPPGVPCAGCHGEGSNGWPLWGAHRGLRTVAAAPRDLSSGSSPAAPDAAEVVAQLARALTDERLFERENAADGLVKLRSPHAVPAASAALADPRPDVRVKAALVLGAASDEHSPRLLEERLADADASVRAAAARALGAIGDASAVSALVLLLKDPSVEVRRGAVAALERLRDPRAIRPLAALMQDPDLELRGVVLGVLERMNDARVLEALLDGTSPATVPVVTSIQVISRLSDPAAVAPIARALRAEHRLVRIEAAQALRRFRDPTAVEALIAALDDPEGRVVLAAIESLAAMPAPEASGALVARARDAGWRINIRAAAVRALGALRVHGAVDALIELLADDAPALREAANAALESLTCRNFGEDRTRWHAWWADQPPDFPVGTCR